MPRIEKLAELAVVLDLDPAIVFAIANGMIDFIIHRTASTLS